MAEPDPEALGELAAVDNLPPDLLAPPRARITIGGPRPDDATTDYRPDAFEAAAEVARRRYPNVPLAVLPESSTEGPLQAVTSLGRGLAAAPGNVGRVAETAMGRLADPGFYATQPPPDVTPGGMQAPPYVAPGQGSTAARVGGTIIGAPLKATIDRVMLPGKTISGEFNPFTQDTEAADWAAETAMGMIARGVSGGAPAGSLGATGGKLKQPAIGEVASLERPPTGNLNPLANERVTFRGKEPKDFTPEDWQAFGQNYGVQNLGPLSPLQTFTDVNGKPFQVPGGTEGKFTYYDLLHMKANPINPALVDRALHGDMQRKLGRTMTPDNLSDADVWNGLVFGMTSPNNPLLPNQMSQSRLRLRTPEMLDDLASSIPWQAGDVVPAATRKAASDRIANRYGLGAAPAGIGTRGTQDYTRIAEMAQLFKQNPAFFRKQPGEDWGQAVERISSQLTGLSMKTGSFGTVWQNPAEAAISAIDRHMARELDKRGGIFASPQERANWENRGVKLWNKRNPENQATGFTDMVGKSGSDGFLGEMLLSHVGNAAKPKFRRGTGEINPNIPSHLADAEFVREPKTVFKMGRAYKQALAVNQRLADESGLNLFMSQWLEWDRIRNRFEPHENMFPGLSNLPAPSVDQLRGVDVAHRQTGHKTYGKTAEGTLKPTRPFAGNPSALGYLGLAGVAAPSAMSEMFRQDEGGR